jgi:hypothetical protein
VNAIVLADSDSDWVAIHRLNGASIEGTRAEMLALAEALGSRRDYAAKRCAVRWDYDGALVSSPRNSISPTVLHGGDVTALAQAIRAEIDGTPLNITQGGE